MAFLAPAPLIIFKTTSATSAAAAAADAIRLFNSTHVLMPANVLYMGCVCAVVGSSRVYLAPVLSVFLSVLVGVSSRVLYCLDANDVALSFLHTTWRLLVRLLRILMGFVNI